MVGGIYCKMDIVLYIHTATKLKQESWYLYCREDGYRELALVFRIDGFAQGGFCVPSGVLNLPGGVIIGR